MAERCNDAHNHTSCFAATIILLRWIFEVQFPCIISGLSLQEKKSKAPKGLNKIIFGESTNEIMISGSDSERDVGAYMRIWELNTGSPGT